MKRQQYFFAIATLALIFFATNTQAYLKVSSSCPLPSLFCRMRHALLNNFYAVQPYHLYRSRQLTAQQLEYYVKAYGIKTVINLRGEALDQKWWQEEVAVLNKLGIQLHNIPMSIPYLQTKENLIQLLELYDNAPQPILIHCKGGADRTGEAAALWKLDQENATKNVALKQLNKKFGHLSELYPTRRFFIEIWSGRDWLYNSYDPSNYPGHCKK